MQLGSLALLFLAACLAAADTQQGVHSQAQLTEPSLLLAANNYYGCRTWVEDVCTQCSHRFYFNLKGVCCEVKPECRNFNLQVGICEACYHGYEIVDGSCVLSQLDANTDKGCRELVAGKCTQCSARWYPGPDGACQPVHQLCRTWSQSDGQCLTCYGGYIIQSGQCVRNPQDTAPVQDLLCALWSNGQCTKCSERAYFRQQKCQQVSQNCQTWDPLDGQCLSCYKGYSLSNGTCSLKQQSNPKDQGCKVWDWQGQRCLECAPRWIFHNGSCISADNLCQTHHANGSCASCYLGYALRDSSCQVCECSRPRDMGCKKWDWYKQICYECSERWFYQEGRGCVPVSDQCKTFNDLGFCTSCYKGYQLVDNQCKEAIVQGPQDAGCKAWDWDNQRCLECSARWVADGSGACKKVSQSCQSYSATGACTACFGGYSLSNGECLLSSQSGPSDPGCSKWDWPSRKCLQCAPRWTFHNGICVSVDNLCLTFDANGICTSCYQGFSIVQNQCKPCQCEKPKDLGCRKWDWFKQICFECSDRWYYKQGKGCVPVDDLCKSHDDFGRCTSCYKGFFLKDGSCQVLKQQGPRDQGCKTWDWETQKCLQCSSRYTFDKNGICKTVNDLCSSFNSEGGCTSCYVGYELINSECSLSKPTPLDKGCLRWDSANQKCLQCSGRWALNREGVCVRVSDLCATFNTSGRCESCYKGYYLQDGQCILQTISTPNDLGCRKWDWDHQKCLQCSDRWSFDSNGRCKPLSDLCQTFNNQEGCASCYRGYQLREGACVLGEPPAPQDKGCKRWDWWAQRCLECSARWTLDEQGACTPVDDQCAQHNSQGGCTECYPGYFLNQGRCQAQNILCKKSDGQGLCLSCYTGYVLYQQQCMLVSSLASLAQYYAACCPDKLAALKNEGRIG